MINFVSSKRSQVTLFVIIAILVVAGVLLYLFFTREVSIEQIPARFQPLEQYYLTCIEENTKIGAQILGAQGGYIYLPDFVPGSEYMPTSSQLNFLGTPVQYWYYLTGNNLIKEEVPSKSEMESQLEEYLEENLVCDFSEYEARGFEVLQEKPRVSVSIEDNEILVDINSNINMIMGEESIRVNSHKTKIGSKLGKFYTTAVQIYNYEKQESFLENYAVDVMRTYAPVDGVELTCSPKIWLKEDIDKELKEALEANMQAIKMKGDYYSLQNKKNEYFVENLPVTEQVNFLYDKKWETKIEVTNNEGVLFAEPIGIQEGLGILGFCYVPYHFVYDITYPVLIQVFDNQELFQFPLAIIIKGNKPREPLSASFFDKQIELCKYPNTEVTVYTYDSSLNPVEARIDFECLRERCNIGETKLEGADSILRGNFPQCINGFIIARAEGYSDKEMEFSTNMGGTADIIMNKLYDLDVELKVDSVSSSDKAVIVFSSENNKQAILWPEQKQVKLSEGEYDITIYVYRDSGITIPSSVSHKCVQMAKPGLAGIFGGTTEKCYDMEIPSQTIKNVISGGGRVKEYFVESQLAKGEISLDVKSLPIPTTLEELGNNYNLLDERSVYIDFK